MQHNLETIHDRQTMNDTIRAFLRSRNYVEVETPLMVASPDIEPTLTPFETIVKTPEGGSYTAGLITSPEYSMKKLLGMGMQKIFTLTKVFRNHESFGGIHNPEFTMLEWYTQGADMFACMDETEALVREVFIAFGREAGVIERKSVPDLFRELIDVDLANASKQDLIDACNRLEVHIDASDTESDLFYRLFLVKIEPTFTDRNILVHTYPKYQAALSRLTPDGKFGERFELYYKGVELCNGFTELTDPIEQRKRFDEESKTRRESGKTTFPIDEDLLNLLASVQNPSFGNALGVDRLLMLATGKTSLEDVLPFSAKKLFH
ncbi:EF-P lysine aminoacylase GenX [Candidatus Uhrbacteria bacterium RIFCSPHIGHO2_02_FULL_47_44]|uniref:EF-P lysine aminoacylase GenX n=1 Tax=Candidatus Uhrbacteria bacterium RIFCSPLOWO2_02_FULL_48_18 TaxID=1802408 RepID=A0A1F7VCS9_9BACT|nr:MAG: EF-P lysine aminoacylase GenX [Candidatus Uhrbacteria bacterium RIFCSPHIGHO2_01_FULL_47_10]OGL71937.1 MAG: EF-P lysine aminoacylase GenX [Candidatus Uhrbacteria bacterium RIFCSPHIGHO2_02_FULL_47_44]OGL76807.1 MAG: EF-P lysine aminoacylase GenX [Candidatus Uhrbacteria bacterium RIFCSPHIGHO2_12_FULL_47_12]OGL80562.1 MAG: EF-P lysine aminoacylase GenX [Candidatus Uhrbacteria bacterium RIFCSPLOWO2_01_FULL_47_17]OGL88255.1 MAG: EF-P lysine aminoacylase GenX [Candidatus Uhrbacteria bacterium 